MIAPIADQTTITLTIKLTLETSGQTKGHWCAYFREIPGRWARGLTKEEAISWLLSTTADDIDDLKFLVDPSPPDPVS